MNLAAAPIAICTLLALVRDVPTGMLSEPSMMANRSAAVTPSGS
jgi:hypothetical protein